MDPMPTPPPATPDLLRKLAEDPRNQFTPAADPIAKAEARLRELHRIKIELEDVLGDLRAMSGSRQLSLSITHLEDSIHRIKEEIREVSGPLMAARQHDYSAD